MERQVYGASSGRDGNERVLPGQEVSRHTRDNPEELWCLPEGSGRTLGIDHPRYVGLLVVRRCCPSRTTAMFRIILGVWVLEV